MLKKRNVRPFKGFVMSSGTFLSSAQEIRHKCRDSSGTHFAEPFQMPESFCVLLSASLFLKKFSPIFFITSPLKAHFVRHFFPFLLRAKTPLIQNDGVRSGQSASLLNPDAFLIFHAIQWHVRCFGDAHYQRRR